MDKYQNKKCYKKNAEQNEQNDVIPREACLAQWVQVRVDTSTLPGTMTSSKMYMYIDKNDLMSTIHLKASVIKKAFGSPILQKSCGPRSDNGEKFCNVNFYIKH